MLRPISQFSARSNARPLRGGSVNLYFLVFMGVTVPTMFFTIDNWRLVEGKAQQQRFCDAAAHAATGKFTYEASTVPVPTYHSLLLYGDPTDIQNLCQTSCIAEAVSFAGRNYVDGVALPLVTTPVNTDVKFGSFDFGSLTPTFTLIDPTAAITPASTLQKRSINAVRVEGFRTIARNNSVALFGPAWTGFTDAQIVTRTTAALDRRVIGFKINKNVESPRVALAFQKIPLAPVALLSEAVDPPVNLDSWDYQVELNADPGNGAITPVAYGLMTVRIPVAGYTAPPNLNATLLDINAATIAEINTQLLNGIPQTDITALGYDILLSDKTAMNPYTVDIPEYTPYPASPSTDLNDLLTTFQTLVTNRTPRVWPLYQSVVGANVRVTGFVAAIVTNATFATDSSMTPKSYISLTLQPTLLETPTAFTDYSNVFLKGTSQYDTYSRLVSPYICRVRLVD